MMLGVAVRVLGDMLNGFGSLGGRIAHRCRLTLEVTRAVADAIGGERCGIRLAPVTTSNDAHDSDPQALFNHLVQGLATLNLAYVHVVEGVTGGAREVPGQAFDYAELKLHYRQAGGRGAWMVNNGYDLAMAEKALANGADLVAFGRPFIANPDLVRRLQLNAPLTPANTKTYYGPGPIGYTDYPTLEAVQAG
jgi:N-ethylmaleimide reductase